MQILLGLAGLLIVRALGHWLLSAAIEWPAVALAIFALLIVGIYFEGQYPVTASAQRNQQ